LVIFLKANILENTSSADEPLIVKSLGYLKVPEAFKVRVGGGSPIHYPNPTASFKVDDKQVHLIYSFPRDISMPQGDGIRLKKPEEE